MAKSTRASHVPSILGYLRAQEAGRQNQGNYRVKFGTIANRTNSSPDAVAAEIDRLLKDKYIKGSLVKMSKTVDSCLVDPRLTKKGFRATGDPSSSKETLVGRLTSHAALISIIVAIVVA